MSYNIDIVIFIGFLFLNLLVGLNYGRGIKTIKDYALGGRNFSTSALSSTIVATWVGGGFFSFLISKTYSDGIYYIIPIFIDYVVTFFIIGYFISSRMEEFLGDISVAEAMGKLYGKNVRIITAISGFLAISGLIGIQFKISSTLFSHFFNVPSIYAMLASSIIVVVYSAFGGIKSVTFTDILQFFTFGAVIPIIGIVIWKDVPSIDNIFAILSTSPNFNFENANFSNHQFIDLIQLSFIFMIPAMHPSIFQRISMAKNVYQVRKSFILSSIILIFIVAITCWIGVLVLSINPNLPPDKIWLYIIDNYSSSGIKGLMIVGITAMIMSTADSYINSSSILASHDIYNVLGNKPNELRMSRVLAFLIGAISIVLAISTVDMLSLMLLANNFYMPIVTVPLLLAIFGFRSTSKSVLIGMGAGFITVVIWRVFYMDITKIDSIIPGVIANLSFLIGSHYLLKQSGGWVGIKNMEPLKLMRLERRRKIQNFIRNIRNFNFHTFCKNNSPKQDYIYSLFGIFCIISVFSTMYSMPKELQQQNNQIIEFIYHTVLFSSSIFLTYPIWPPTFKQEKFIIIAWNIAVPYILLFAPILLIIISNFGQFQLMVLMLNIIIMAILLRWQIVIFMIVFSAVVSVEFCKWFVSVENLTLNFGTLQFKIMYSLLLVSSALIAFLKPKQERQELTEQQNVHLEDRMHLQEEELEKSQKLKYEFLRNLEHEVHAPITGITSMGQVLHDNYDKLNEKQRRQAIEEIAKSSQRLNSLTNNLLDLSKLSSLTYDLHKTKLNLSELLYVRLDHCKKLYLNNKELEFFTEIEPDVRVNCDQHYITSTIDNLIINAIQYSKDGKITTKLTKTTTNVEFSIQDEGIGIPLNELRNIFGAFVVSSKTRTPAGGRGIGLALCEKAIKVHGGTIWAKSDGVNGATFTFTLPV